MLISTEQALFVEEDEQVVDQALFSEPEQIVKVPRNKEELVHQLALANETSDITKQADELMKHGAHALVSDVAVKEREERVGAAKTIADIQARLGNPLGVEGAARAILAEQERSAIPPTSVEGNKAVAERALEVLAFQTMAGRYKSPLALGDQLEREGSFLGFRNLLNQKMAELEEETTFGDVVAHLSTQLIPFFDTGFTKLALDDAMGVTNVEAARRFWSALKPEERREVMSKLLESSDNPARTAELLRKLAQQTDASALMDSTFDALSLFDVAAITKGLAYVYRRGAPLVTVNNTAGPDAAAKLAVGDLMQGSKAGGLNDADLMAKFLAAGKNPFDADPTAISGMSAAGQRELRQAWDQLVDGTRNRLISSGLTPDEIKQGLAEIRAKYSADTNQAIHSVIFGEGSELGQDMTVFWQGADGRAFGSKEAAEAWAKAEGKVAYEVVPRNTADTTFKMDQTPFDDWDGPDADDIDAINAYWRSHDNNYLSPVAGKSDREINDYIDELMPSFGHGPETDLIIDAFKAAAKAGKTEIDGAQVLTILASQSPDLDYRFLARHMLTKLGEKAWAKVPVRVRRINPKGEYDSLKDTVDIRVDEARNPEAYLHELMHAHNAQVISMAVNQPKLAAKLLSVEQRAAAKELEELRTRLIEWQNKALGKESEKYGSLANIMGKLHQTPYMDAALVHASELVSYGMTNASVRDLLKNIKLSDLGYAAGETVYSKVWDIFRRLIGLRANDTALAKLTESFDKLTASIKQEERALISDTLKKGKISRKEAVGALTRGKMEMAGKKKSQDINVAIDKEISSLEKKLTKVGDAEREMLVERIQALRASKKKPRLKGPAGTLSPTEEWLVKETRSDPVSFANVGKFSEEDIRSMPWLALDPKHAASELAVEERVIGVHAEAKTRHDLTKHLAPFFNKLSGAGKTRVKAVLEEGDSISNGGSFGKEFNYMELRARGLDENEAAAYFAARQVRMVSYHLRNAEMVRALRADGFKEVELLATGDKFAGRVLDRQQAAGASLGKTVFDMVTGQPLFVDSDKLDEAYAAGKQLVQFKSPVDVGRKHYSMMLVDATSAKARDITTALHYRPGEFSRIYTDQYFITVKKMMEVDGVVREVPETVRTAASQREAAEFVEAHNKAIRLLMDEASGRVPRNVDADLEKLIGRYQDVADFRYRFDQGELDGYISMDWHYTRNKDEYLNSSVSEAVSNGRLFTSKRSQKLFSVDADRRNTLDVYESLEAEITNIGRVANISMWRDNMIRRWMNSFGDMVPGRTGNDVADFYAAAGARFTRGTPEAKFAERTHRYIMRQLGVRTQEEKFYESITRQLTEKLFTGNERIEHIGAAIRQKGWLGFLRNINFNLNLGMFNPAQLIVQANGAATALVLSPVHGAKAAFTFPLLRMALMSDNPQVWRNLARVESLKNLGLSNEDEFVSLVKALRKTGLLDNLRSTSLWNAEEGALNVFAGYPRRAASSHTFFFNRGEEFSRVVSFDVARREWMAANPGQDWTRSDVLKHLVVRADDLTQNMTKANLARWQEGAMSIPLQFAQYNLKLALNVMSAFAKGGKGRGFTRLEATQLMLGHIMLYGAAGNGLVWAMDEVLGDDIKDSLSVEAKQLLAQGLTGWVFDQMAELLTGEGAKVAMGSRLGSFDYYQRIADAVFTDPKNVYEALLGPTVGSAKRLGVIGEVASLWMKDPDLSAQDVLEGLGKMGTEQVAALRNGAKAYLFLQHQGRMLDRQGVSMGELNKNELLMQALGFMPTQSFDIHNMIRNKQAHGEALDDIARQIMRTQRDIVTALHNDDPKRADELRKLLVALWPENAGDFREVQRRIRNRLWPYETQFQKLIGDYIRKGHTHSKPLVVTQEPRKQQ